MKSKMYYSIIVVLLNICFLQSTTAQTLVDVTYLKHLSKNQLLNDYSVEVNQGLEINNSLNLYKIRYTTQGSDALQDTASGLLAIPGNREMTYPILAYQHGTVSAKDSVPSRLSEGSYAPIIMAAEGYICVAADYLGLGDSRGFHPYLHATTQASAVIDLLYASQEFFEKENIAFNKQLFISGYSQGGHATLALQRELEANYLDQFYIEASAPMSGPYSLSQEMKKFTLSEERYLFPAFLANVALGYQAAYGTVYTHLEEIFDSKYARHIREYEQGVINLTQLNERLAILLLFYTGDIFPKNMVQPNFLNQLKSDPTHPFNLYLKENDVLNFTPKASTRLLYCKNDEFVVYTNATLSDSIFNAAGANDVQAYDVDSTLSYEYSFPEIDFNKLVHLTCGQPAILAALDFFRPFKETVSLEEIHHSDISNLTLYPNPTNTFLHINAKMGKVRNIEISLINQTGQTVISEYLNNVEGIFQHTIDVHRLPKGLYLLKIQSAEHQQLKKVWIGNR